MSFDLEKFLKDGSVTKVLQNVGAVASIFNPTVGKGLILASNVTDAMDDVDDTVLENDVIGLNGTALRLDKMIEDNNVDFAQLEMLSHNLKSISNYLQKSAKLVM